MTLATTKILSRSAWTVAAVAASLFMPSLFSDDFGARDFVGGAAYAQTERQGRPTRYNDSMYCDENGYRWVRQRVSISGGGGSATLPLRCDWVGLDVNRKRPRN